MGQKIANLACIVVLKLIRLVTAFKIPQISPVQSVQVIFMASYKKYNIFYKQAWYKYNNYMW